MTQKFEDYTFFYLKIILILLFTIIISLLTSIITMGMSIFSHSNKFYRKISYISFGVFFFSLLVTYIYFFVTLHTMPEELDITSNKDYEYSQGGLTTKIKIDKENNEILKKSMSMFFEQNDNVELQNVYSRVINSFSRRSKNKLPLASYFVFALNKYYNWRSVKIREKYSKEIEFLVKTYDLDEKDCSWKEEYITYSMDEFKNLDKNKIKLQLKKLDNFLKKKKLYLNDVRPDNIRLTKKGDVRIIDGEFFTDNEMKYYKFVPYVFPKLPHFERLTHIDKSLTKYYI